MTLSRGAEVADALARGAPVVALESTILAHGLPAPRNREVADRIEQAVRQAGAVPATIAVLDGVRTVGLDTDQLDRLCDPAAGFSKLSLRDLGAAAARGSHGATTVASTAAIAWEAGIAVFATGGLGGVHRDAERSWDVSADLQVLANTPIAVVCSGVKSVLDIGATLELLETLSVPVVGYGTDEFPAFYLRSSGFGVPWRVDAPSELAALVSAHWSVPATRAGVLVANPVPPHAELDRSAHDTALASGLAVLAGQGIRGKDVTPALLGHFHATTGGASLRTNEELVLSNARLAAELAVALHELSSLHERDPRHVEHSGASKTHGTSSTHRTSSTYGTKSTYGTNSSNSG